MSDEEMARLFIIDKYGIRKDLEIFRIKQDEDLCKDFYAFIAGLKASRPKWHDLRKNPEDLPKRMEGVWCKTEYDDYCEGYWWPELNRWRDSDNDDGDTIGAVIAWCEIPKFEEVEELLDGK